MNVRPEPRREDVEALKLLFKVALRLLATCDRGEKFPARRESYADFLAAGREIVNQVLVLDGPDGWPVDFHGGVGIVLSEDGSAMLLLSEIDRTGALPRFRDDSGVHEQPTGPEVELLVVHSDGVAVVGWNEEARKLLGLVL